MSGTSVTRKNSTSYAEEEDIDETGHFGEETEHAVQIASSWEQTGPSNYSDELARWKRRRAPIDAHAAFAHAIRVIKAHL